MEYIAIPAWTYPVEITADGTVEVGQYIQCKHCLWIRKAWVNMSFVTAEERLMADRCLWCGKYDIYVITHSGPFDDVGGEE